jgi:hypothetical protein
MAGPLAAKPAAAISTLRREMSLVLRTSSMGVSAFCDDGNDNHFHPLLTRALAHRFERSMVMT